MEKLTGNKSERLPKPPIRIIFRTNRGGYYHHTVMLADLHLNVKGVTTGRFDSIDNIKPNFSENPVKTPEKTG